MSYGAAHGAYQTGYYLTDSQLELSLLVNTIGEALTPIAAGSMKISIALMLLRLIGRTARWQKWFLWALITSTAIISIITVFVTFFQCGNPQAIWNVALKAETTCSDLSVFVNEVFFVSGSPKIHFIAEDVADPTLSVVCCCRLYSRPVSCSDNLQTQHVIGEKDCFVRLAWARSRVRAYITAP